MTKVKLVRNRAQCLICFDIVESTHRHDFKACKCGAMFVDGGLDYMRRGAEDFDKINELCEYAAGDVANNDATGLF